MSYTAGQILTAALMNDLEPGTRIRVPDGTVALPSVTNDGDENTGIYFHEADGVAVVSGGAQRLRVDSDGKTRVIGETGSVAELMIVHADAAGDSALYFGDATDSIQAGLYYDESDQELEIRGYNNVAVAKTTANTQLAFVSGTAALPSIAFASDLDLGMYRGASNQVAFATEGTQRLTIGSSQVTAHIPIRVQDGSATSPSVSFADDTNTGMYRVAADQLGFAAGGTESFRIVDSGATQEIFPGVDNGFTLGHASRRWEEIFSANSTINTSDMRLKVETGQVPGIEFISQLRPFAGKWLSGGGDRTHWWLGAQEVLQALKAEGIDTDNLGVWREAGDDQETEVPNMQMLAMEEFIPPIIQALLDIYDMLS